MVVMEQDNCIFRDYFDLSRHLENTACQHGSFLCSD